MTRGGIFAAALFPDGGGFRTGLKPSGRNEACVPGSVPGHCPGVGRAHLARARLPTAHLDTQASSNPADVPAFTAVLQALSRAHLQRPRRVWRPRHGGGVERLGERRLSLWILSGRTHKHVLQTGQAGCYPGTGPSVSSFSPLLPRVKCTDARDLPGNPPIREDASPL